jgi:hypothetical protein
MHLFIRTTAFLCSALAALALSQPAVSAGDNADPQEGITVEARGPVHEAYAQPLAKDPKAMPVVPKKPPAPIPEEPPEQKPEGMNVHWIPGYWAWDQDRNDFIWVSGLWRVPPPDREWVPGYWTNAEGGARWVPGYWAEASQQVPNMVPQPPESVENGPPEPAPNDDQFYVPGSWLYRDSGYVWRPGYWSPGYADWVWNPGCYYWTPSGYIYSSGYWDYPLAGRGLLFAPVYFNRPFWNTAGWFYRPRWVVGSLLSSLFIRPYWGCYYFGDYYGPGYASLGFYPWYSFGYRFNDPLFGYYWWRHGFDRNWWNAHNERFLGRQNGTLPRPPRTLAAQNALLAKAGTNANLPRTVTPLSQFQSKTRTLGSVSGPQRTQFTQQAQRMRSVSAGRSQIEKGAAANTAPATRPPRSSQAPSYRSFSSYRGGDMYRGGSMSFSRSPSSFSGGGYRGGGFSSGASHYSGGGHYGGGGHSGSHSGGGHH